MLAMTPDRLKSLTVLCGRSKLQCAAPPFSAQPAKLLPLCRLRGPAPDSKVFQRPALSSQQWSKVLAWARSLEVYRLRLQKVSCMCACYRGLAGHPYVCVCPLQLTSDLALPC